MIIRGSFQIDRQNTALPEGVTGGQQQRRAQTALTPIRMNSEILHETRTPALRTAHQSVWTKGRETKRGIIFGVG